MYVLMVYWVCNGSNLIVSPCFGFVELSVFYLVEE